MHPNPHMIVLLEGQPGAWVVHRHLVDGGLSQAAEQHSRQDVENDVRVAVASVPHLKL